MTYQITWREVNLGHMIVETEEEAQEFIQQPDMDDPRFTWKKSLNLMNVRRWNHEQTQISCPN